MNVMNEQLILIFVITFMTITLWIRLGKIERKNGGVGEKVWEIHTYHKSNGKRETIGIPEGCYKMGNGIWNDIRIRASGDKARILLQVQKQQLYFTVLRGTVSMNNRIYRPNYKEQIPLGEYKKMQVGDCQLQFTRVR